MKSICVKEWKEWQKGLEKKVGRIIGRSEGLMEGEKREKKTTLLSLLKVKLGNVSNQLEQAIQNSSIEKLNTLTLSIFDITNEDDVLKIIN